MEKADDLSLDGQAEQKHVLLASIVASSDDAIISKTLDGIVTSWNAAAERLFGYSAAEAVGQHISLIIPPDRQGEEAHIIARLKQGEQVDHFETIRRRKDGASVTISLTVSPLINSRGQIIGASKIARDITDQKRSEARLRSYVAALELSNRDLEEFAYIASHDLKEPLRGLSNNATFLKEECEGFLDNSALRRLSRIHFLTQRIENLIDILLQYSRLARCDLAVEDVDVDEVARDAIGAMDKVLATGGANVTVRSPLPTLKCDGMKLREVLIHLIRNAIKYNDRPEKRIEIGVRHGDGEATEPIFYVQDNGIGIESMFLDEVFRIFRRLNVEDEDKRSYGVGLTFARQIITRHGGKIWLESCPGEGTTVLFTLAGTDVDAAAA